MVLEPELLDPNSGWQRIPASDSGVERWVCQDSDKVLAWLRKHDLDISSIFEVDATGVAPIFLCPQGQWDFYSLHVAVVNDNVQYALFTMPDVCGKMLPVDLVGVVFTPTNGEEFMAQMNNFATTVKTQVKINHNQFSNVPPLHFSWFRDLLYFDSDVQRIEAFIAAQRLLNPSFPKFSDN